ncbi:MAG: sigma-70 family RNA polymerase sigma factor, partial [Planctomycetota bacterium]
PMGFKLKSLDELSRQMRYAPRGKRLEQLKAAEDLLLSIDSGRAYPPGYVKHAITGYRAKDADAKVVSGGNQMTGVALQHDLGLLIETVSGAMDLSVNDDTFAGEPILDLASAGERFGVTGKTLQRWRRKGLPARRLLFDDGKQRIAFRLSCAERFLARHDDGSSDTEAAGSAILADERDQLAGMCERLVSLGCDQAEIVHRLSRRVGRSMLETRSVLQATPESRFDAAAKPPSDELAGVIAERLDAGESLSAVAADAGVRRSSAYLAAMSVRADRLVAATVKYHADDLFDGDPIEAEPRVKALVKAARESIASNASDDDGLTKRPRGLPPYLAALYETRLLSPAEERAGFLLYNFHKFRFATLRRRLDPHLCRRREIRQLERHLCLAREARNRLLEANLRLVVHVARKHCRPGLDLMDLVSDGNVTLMRAVEGFDVGKGFKFSTYATMALVKGFARSVPAMQAEQASGQSVLPDRPHVDRGQDRVADLEELEQLFATLDDRERRVVFSRFDFGDADESAEDLESSLGLSSRRVRQLEANALDKLREAAGV